MRDYTPSPSHNLSHFLRNPHTPRGMTYFTDIPRTFITGQGLFCLNWKHYTGRGVSYFTCLYTWSGPDGWNVGHVIEKWHNLCLSINCTFTKHWNKKKHASLRTSKRSFSQPLTQQLNQPCPLWMTHSIPSYTYMWVPMTSTVEFTFHQHQGCSGVGKWNLKQGSHV